MSEMQSVEKPLTMALIAGALDMYVMGEENMNRTMMFAGAVAVGNYASQYAVPIIKKINVATISRNLYDTKTLVERIVEVSSSTAFVYVLNKYVLNNDIYRNELMKRVGVIVIADVASTYALEYFNSQPLEFLTHN